VHGHTGGRPPRVDLAAERALAALLHEAGQGEQSLLTSAHDLSDGGLAQALVEAALRHGVGVSVEVPDDAFVALFSESPGRAIVTVPDADAELLVALAQQHGVPVTALGVTGGDALVVEGRFEVPLDEVRTAWTSTLPAALA
jgi:phosphoribosylformylglycinamidine synthase